MGMEDQFGRPVSQQRVAAREKHGVHDDKKAEVVAYAVEADMDASIRDKKAGYGVSARRKKSLAEAQMKQAGLAYDLARSAERKKLPAEGKIKKAVQEYELPARRRRIQPHESLSGQLTHAKPLGDQLFQARENFLQARDAYDPEKNLLEGAIKSYRLELDRELQKARDSKDEERAAQLQEEMRKLESVRYGAKAVFKAETTRPRPYMKPLTQDEIERKKDPEGLDKMSFGRYDTEDDEADLG